MKKTVRSLSATRDEKEFSAMILKNWPVPIYNFIYIIHNRFDTTFDSLVSSEA